MIPSEMWKWENKMELAKQVSVILTKQEKIQNVEFHPSNNPYITGHLFDSSGRVGIRILFLPSKFQVKVIRGFESITNGKYHDPLVGTVLLHLTSELAEWKVPKRVLGSNQGLAPDF